MAPSSLNRFSSTRDDEEKRRQAELTKIIESKPYEKQESLVTELRNRGFLQVSQTTVSRDLKELGIEKDKKTRFYTLSEQARLLGHRTRLDRAILEDVENIFSDVGFFALRTSQGHARSTGVIVQNCYPDQVVGVIAEEDTVLIITKGKNTAESLSKALSEMLHRSRV